MGEKHLRWLWKQWNIYLVKRSVVLQVLSLCLTIKVNVQNADLSLKYVPMQWFVADSRQILTPYFWQNVNGAHFKSHRSKWDPSVVLTIGIN